mmetsp:Transcript_22193/g.48162  ORF Transcript_22193/g.48162 Transcript_22193/m.48162 type:complete len:339 (-) Transcript_22193:3982-4998(-)
MVRPSILSTRIQWQLIHSVPSFHLVSSLLSPEASIHQRYSHDVSSVRRLHDGVFANKTSPHSFPTCIDVSSLQHHHLHTLQLPSLSTHCYSIQTRQLATIRRGSKAKAKDDNAPLLNEHLIAQLMEHNVKNSTAQNVSPETSEVRLIVDFGRNANKSKGTASSSDDDDSDSDDEDTSNISSNPSPQIVTINEAISIAHNHGLDLMEVTLKSNPPVIKAVDFDKYIYEQKRKESKLSKDKSKGGAISDKPLKEFKFRAGIDNHDLERKASNMIKYLDKGHAIRVTLTARQRSLNADAKAIETTLDRVKELVGDKAVEVRGMKSNDRGSYGSLLLHPNKK